MLQRITDGDHAENPGLGRLGARFIGEQFIADLRKQFAVLHIEGTRLHVERSIEGIGE